MQADPTKTHVALELKHNSPLICCRFDPLGRFVFAGAEDNSIQRWPLSTSTAVGFVGHESWVNALTFSHDSETLISGGCDGNLIWWNATAEKPEPIRKLAAHQGWVRSVTTNPSGDTIATAGNDRLVKLWSTSDGQLIRELPGHEAHVYSVWFHPAGEFLLSGDLKGVVKQWKIADGSLVRTFDAKPLHSYNGGQGVDFGGVRTISVSHDQKRLACGGLHKAENPLGAVHEPLVLEFDWESQKLLQSHVADGVKGVAWRVAYHPDGYLIGVSGGSSGGFLLFWKSDQDKEFHRFALPKLARDLDLHPDALQVATAHYDNTLRISRLAPKT
jgi:WD40 repeat protein